MQLPSFLPPHLATLLRAVTRTDEAGRSAFLEWRATTRLDDITGPAFKMLPVLVALFTKPEAIVPAILMMGAGWLVVMNALQPRIMQGAVGIQGDGVHLAARVRELHAVTNAEGAAAQFGAGGIICSHSV